MKKDILNEVSRLHEQVMGLVDEALCKPPQVAPGAGAWEGAIAWLEEQRRESLKNAVAQVGYFGQHVYAGRAFAYESAAGHLSTLSAPGVGVVETPCSGRGGPMDALQIVCADRDVWKARALAAEGKLTAPEDWPAWWVCTEGPCRTRNLRDRTKCGYCAAPRPDAPAAGGVRERPWSPDHARLANIVDEAFGTQPMMSPEDLLTFLERSLFEIRKATGDLDARLSARDAEIGRLRGERDEARADYEAVAEAMGYVNHAEGQGGVEVAPVATLIAAFKGLHEERDRWFDIAHSSEAIEAAVAEERAKHDAFLTRWVHDCRDDGANSDADAVEDMLLQWRKQRARSDQRTAGGGGETRTAKQIATCSTCRNEQVWRQDDDNESRCSPVPCPECGGNPSALAGAQPAAPTSPGADVVRVDLESVVRDLVWVDYYPDGNNIVRIGNPREDWSAAGEWPGDNADTAAIAHRARIVSALTPLLANARREGLRHARLHLEGYRTGEYDESEKGETGYVVISRCIAEVEHLEALAAAAGKVGGG